MRFPGEEGEAREMGEEGGGGGPVAMQHLPTVWWCLPRQAKLHVYS